SHGLAGGALTPRVRPSPVEEVPTMAAFGRFGYRGVVRGRRAETNPKRGRTGIGEAAGLHEVVNGAVPGVPATAVEPCAATGPSWVRLATAVHVPQPTVRAGS